MDGWMDGNPPSADAKHISVHRVFLIVNKDVRKIAKIVLKYLNMGGLHFLACNEIVVN